MPGQDRVNGRTGKLRRHQRQQVARYGQRHRQHQLHPIGLEIFTNRRST